MSDSNFNRPPHDHVPRSNPPPRAAQTQDSGSLAPNYPNYAPPPMRNHGPPGTYPQLPSQYRTQLPETPMYSSTYQPNRFSVHMQGTTPAPGYHVSSPEEMVQYPHPTVGAPSSNPYLTGLYSPGTSYWDAPPYVPPIRSTAMDNPMQPSSMQQSTLQGVGATSQPPWSSNFLPENYRPGQMGSASNASTRPNPPGSNMTQSSGAMGGTGMWPINMEFPNPYTLPNRVPAGQRLNTQPARIPTREMTDAPNTTARPAGRVLLPRTSHRRSFDRYSTDLTAASSSPESGSPHTPTHRSSRRRIGDATDDLEYRALLMAHRHDPNVVSTQQIQQLKDKLTRHVSSELEEDVSPTCDICQKDYSNTLVEPSEEEEVAVKLPCKHVFGEYCIHTWFDTCKTYRNKITCPMCRAVLAEPPQRARQLIRMLSQAGYAGMDPNIYREHRRLFESLAATRDLEGDFAHT